jgi:hypothetical protein
MTALYEMPAKLREILSRADEDTGELPESACAELDALTLAIPAKIEHTGLFIRELLSEADGIAEEADRLAAMVRTRKNRAERLKAYLRDCMIAPGMPRVVEGKLCKVRVQKNNDSVYIEDPKAIPWTYLYPPAAPDINKAAILTVLKTGDKVPGARLADETFHVRIK